MITYKNDTYSTKTFYGVTFLPGDVKSVSGYINCDGMVLTSETYTVDDKLPEIKPKRQYNKKTQESKSVDTELELITETEILKEESING